MSKKEIILASKSPRRKEIMSLVGLEFSVQVSDVEEIVPEGCPIEKESEYLSGLKAEAVFREHEDAIVIGSDTLVAIDGDVLGKPKTVEGAKAMLRRLSGRTHTVFTGVTVFWKENGETRKDSFTSRTEVTFYELDDGEIDRYVATGEPMDKAGAYGIQGFGARLVKGIEGDYFTVMGLPIAEVLRRIEAIEAGKI